MAKSFDPEKSSIEHFNALSRDAVKARTGVSEGLRILSEHGLNRIKERAEEKAIDRIAYENKPADPQH
jgi:hypothetical protein